MTKPISDWKPEDFIQHECQLDQYERTLYGMARAGSETSNPESFRAMQRIVIAHRIRREQYFNYHKIEFKP